ncbi:S41 family peptidase [Kitasatospora sp. NPDC002040]|uniref:S41 family peptidase n=1 Tax=Kitasatospora sp. NPDC002040 TaxID=3154661 RepID=UPI00332066A3
MTSNHEILDAALAKITSRYVFPEVTAALEDAIRGRAAGGEYTGLAGPELCAAVTAHLQEVQPDKHLRLLWSDEAVPVEEDDSPEEEKERWAAYYRKGNYGIQRVEQLDGNIGYLDLRFIPDADAGYQAFGAAMQLVAHTDGLVIDLRNCRGGSPNGVALWCSFFFADDELHLNDIYDRETDSTRQFWTYPHLPAPRYLDRPVTVLTAAFTFSGGEELAYNLQANRRATLIGETTRGGAHPTERFALTPHVAVTVPTARSINPITKTNWEGVGVVPEVAVPADQALETALSQLREPVQG